MKKWVKGLVQVSVWERKAGVDSDPEGKAEMSAADVLGYSILNLESEVAFIPPSPLTAELTMQTQPRVSWV